MTKKRLIVLFAVLAGAIFLVMLRVFVLSQNHLYSQNAGRQMITTLTVCKERGHIYDRNGFCFTKGEEQILALCVPGESAYHQLFSLADYKNQELLYKRRNSSAPFLIHVNNVMPGIYNFTVHDRTPLSPLAVHLIGYTNSEGSGMAGIEKAFDRLLTEAGDIRRIECATTAQGEIVPGMRPIERMEKGTGDGLVLTIDAGIQNMCETIADNMIEKGCIIVLECTTGKVVSVVSRPQYDPEDIVASIQAQDTSLIDRSMASFSVGSVFKTVLAAAACENGLSWYSMECRGAVEIDGQVYHCAKNIAHGEVNMQKALEQSCNCYFIRLGHLLGGKKILSMAKNMGFAAAMPLVAGMNAGRGFLPSEKTLQNSGQLSVFSFGQGQLLATPLQVAAMMNTIANDGVFIAPTAGDRIINTKGETLEDLGVTERKKVMEKDTAQKLQKMLLGVVENGIGQEAATEKGLTAGKTGTAQTGRFNEEGDEQMDYWFAGFFPAEAPEYTVVVLQDDTSVAKESCASVFSQICSMLSLLKSG